MNESKLRMPPTRAEKYWKERAQKAGRQNAALRAALDTRAATIERCAGELDRLRQHEFGGDDQFAIGFNEAINQAQFRIRALKDKP